MGDEMKEGKMKKWLSDLLSVTGQFHVTVSREGLVMFSRVDADGPLPVGEGKIELLPGKLGFDFHFQGFGRKPLPGSPVDGSIDAK